MKSLPMSLLSDKYKSKTIHCHIFFTDKKNSARLDHIFFSLEKGALAFCELAYSLFKDTNKEKRLRTEKDLYNFISNEKNFDTVVVKENEKVVLCFQVCHSCNMSALN